MTDEQIKAIARDFAVEATRSMAENLDESSCLLNETMRMNEEYAGEVIRFLLRDYCVISKEDIRAEINLCNEMVRWYGEDTDVAVVDTLKSLFGSQIEEGGEG